MSHGHGPRKLDPSELTVPSNHSWHKVPRVAGIIGIVGLVATFGIGFAGDTHQLYFSYLTGYIYFLTLGIGGLFFVLFNHAARAGWSVVVRRLAENIMGTLPVMAVLFLPILLGAHDLYHWSHEEVVAEDELLQAKSGWLNMAFFSIRAVIFLGTWVWMSRWFMARSLEQDATGDKRLSRRMQIVAGPALFAFALSVTYGSFDWLMSLDPHWYSTMFGVYFFAGCALSMFAFMSLLMVWMRRANLARGIITIEHQHDIGKFMFGFVVFWAYVAFSQFMLIWYANIPEETAWFAHRYQGGWYFLGVVLAVGHFAIPFFFLMSRHIKRFDRTLVIGALWVLVMHYVDLYYIIMPTLHHHDVHVSPLDFTALIGVGGVFVWAFLGNLLKHPLVPKGDPRLQESLKFENF